MPGYQDPDCTVFVSNVDQKVTPEHLWELFLQAGPLRNVHIPTERGTGKQRTFGFVTYRHEVSVAYACELFNTLKLFDRPIYCKPSGDNANKSNSQTPQSQDRKSVDGGFNRNNSIDRDRSFNREQHSPQADYYRDNNNIHNNYQRQQSFNNQTPSPHYSENRNQQNYNERNSPRHYNSTPSRSQDNYAQNNDQKYPGLNHSLSSPANLNFGSNSQLFMRVMNQRPRQGSFHPSPFHDSPSHHGPMRHDRDRNHQNSRMNRRQQGYPY